MSCTVEYRRLYCTTADVSFGPRFDSDEEGEQFRAWVYKNYGDPRYFNENDLAMWYVAWKGAKL